MGVLFMLLLYQKVLKIGMGYFGIFAENCYISLSLFTRKKFTGYNTEVKRMEIMNHLE